jgi:hypothetical protein
MCRRMSCAAIASGALIVLSALFLVTSSASRAGTVTVTTDFETIPGGAPIDGLPIGNQFPNAKFRLEGDGFPVLAEVGGPATAFFGPPGSTSNDTPVAGTDIGNFFLTDDGMIPSPPEHLIITFKQRVSGLGGDLLDVDNQEVWKIEARDQNGNVIETKTISDGDPNTGDGVATHFSFSHASNDIKSVRIVYDGVDPHAGFAFDNMSATQMVPLPAAVWSGLSLLGGLGAFKRLRRARR